MFVLQCLVSVLFLLHKVFLVRGAKSGWLYGVAAAFLAIFYFYFLGLFVYTSLEVGLVVLMGYGFFKGEKKSPGVEMAIRVLTALVMLFLARVAWIGMITVVELVSSLALLVGTYVLIHGGRKVGWWLYVLGHLTAAYLGYNRHPPQLVFVALQVMSAVVCTYGAAMVAKTTQNKESGHA